MADFSDEVATETVEQLKSLSDGSHQTEYVLIPMRWLIRIEGSFTSDGLQVTHVTPGGPASRMTSADGSLTNVSLEPGDVIVSINDAAVLDDKDWAEALAKAPDHNKVKLTVVDVETGQANDWFVKPQLRAGDAVPPSPPVPPAGSSTTPDQAPDGQKPKKFPITASNDSVVGGSAICEVDEDGTVRGHIHGENANQGGTVKFSAAVLLIGFHGGTDPDSFLHAMEWHTLTVGSQVIGTNKKDTDFVDGNKVKKEDLNNIRRIALLLERDKGDGDLLDQIKQLAKDAGDLVDTADVLYKKVQNSDVGQAVETTAAAG